MSLATVAECSSTRFNNSLPGLNRRRSLFPCDATDSESDSDLGHISPLNFDSSFDQDSSNVLTPKQLTPKQSQKLDLTVGDYDIIDIVQNQDQVTNTPQGKQSQLEDMSPLYLSPHFNKIETSVAETPSKNSPYFKLKTPHDAPNTNSKLPKLSRKSLLDSEVTLHSNKRKLSPYNSPEHNKQIKLDLKPSRVRTTLFPEVEFALSTKSFYPKSERKMEKNKRKDTVSKSSVLFNTNRKYKSHKKIGQINAGVGHKIRKPKPKNFNKPTLVKDTLNAMGNNKAITEYILDIKNLRSNNVISKLIDNKENTGLSKSPQRSITSAFMPEKNIEPFKRIIKSPVVPEKNVVPSQRLISPAILPEKKIEQNKRRLSPEPEPDSKKKFFKFSRSKGVVNVVENIQIEVDHGRITLSEKNKYSTKSDFDMTDLSVDDSDMPKTNIDNILSCLDEEEEESVTPKVNKIVLQATNSVVASENSILLHHPTCTADLILSPISQMCDVTSGLALNTPKKVRNLTPILEEITDIDIVTDQKEEKMYPVFYPGHSGTPGKKDRILTNAQRKFKKLSDDQMLLDAGQKKFGVTHCNECDYVYHQGDPSDEKIHFNFHSGKQILRFPGWKIERVVADFQNNGRIIQIIPRDSKIWWKKASELMDVINMQLGCYDMKISLDNSQVFLYIKKKSIIGCLVATPKSEGYQLLNSTDNNVDLCSQHPYPIKCGISRIWVSPEHRRLGVATQMMHALKRNFIKGSVLRNIEIALSSPTDLGKAFAAAFFKNNHFFVYP